MMPSALGSIRTGVLLTVLGNGTFAASQFIILVWLAHSASTHDVGRFALAFAVTAPVFLFANLKLRLVQATDIGDEFSPRQYLRLRAWSALAAVMFFGVTGTASVWPEGTNLLVVETAILKGLDLASDSFYAPLHRRGQFGYIALSTSLRGSLSAACFILIFSTGGSLEAAQVGSIVTYAIGAFLDFRFASQVTKYRCDAGAARLWPLWRMVAPLGLAMAVASLGVNLPRYALEHTAGTSAVGIYSAIAYLPFFGGMLIAAIGQVATPHLAHRLAAGREPFVRLLRRLVLLGASLSILLCIVVGLAGEALLGLLFGPAYAQAKVALIVLFVGTIPGYSAVFLGTGLNALREYRPQLPINIVMVIVTGICSLPLTATWGITGASAALTLGGTVGAILYAVVFSRRLRAERGARP